MARMWSSRVVFPAPRKPDSTVTAHTRVHYEAEHHRIHYILAWSIAVGASFPTAHTQATWDSFVLPVQRLLGVPERGDAGTELAHPGRPDWVAAVKVRVQHTTVRRDFPGPHEIKHNVQKGRPY